MLGLDFVPLARENIPMTPVVADLKKLFASASFYFVGNAFSPSEPAPDYDITSSWQTQQTSREPDLRFFWTRRMWMVCPWLLFAPSFVVYVVY